MLLVPPEEGLYFSAPRTKECGLSEQYEMKYQIVFVEVIYETGVCDW